jgi:hypothetical protein
VQSLGGWKTVLMALAGLKILSMTGSMTALALALSSIGSGLVTIATSGPGAVAALGLLAEEVRKQGFEKAIPVGPNHDQQVAEAQAGGIVTPDTGGKSVSPWGSIGDALTRPAEKLPPRGIRNNNPGNIKYGDFAYKMGASGRDSGGFAIFPDMQTGTRAEEALLRQYVAQGNNTVRKIISKYAPSSENDTNGYIEQVSKKLGIGADQVLSNAQLGQIANAIYVQENGSQYAIATKVADQPTKVDSDKAKLANAAEIARQPTGVAASTPTVNNSSSSSTSSAETHFHGDFHINTQATDANGIARDMGSSLKRYQFTLANANTGMS